MVSHSSGVHITAVFATNDEIVRVVCLNAECEHHGHVRTYDGNYRQHSIALCGGCGGEFHELTEGETHEPGSAFRRVRLHHPARDDKAPRLHGLTQAERAAGWELRTMVGKVPPEEVQP
jgi:hypothetical protein